MYNPIHKKETKMSTTITPAPTQVTHPFKAVLRTIFQNIIVWVPAVILAAPMLSEFIEENFPGTPVPAAIIAVTAFLISATGFVARLMAIPAINSAFTKIGLGATPKKAELSPAEQYNALLKAPGIVVEKPSEADESLSLVDEGYGK
jgi:hypothetical protein